MFLLPSASLSRCSNHQAKRVLCIEMLSFAQVEITFFASYVIIPPKKRENKHFCRRAKTGISHSHVSGKLSLEQGAQLRLRNARGFSQATWWCDKEVPENPLD